MSSDNPRNRPQGGLPPLPPELDPRGRSAARAGGRRRALPEAKSSNAKRWTLIGTGTIATLLSIALVVASGVYWWHYRQFNNGLSTVSIKDGKKNSDVGKDIDGQDQNILVTGNDDRQTATDNELYELGTTRDGGSLNTDTMMVIHVPADGSKATIISFPRDSYVDIPGHSKNKLNSAYPTGFRASSGTHKQKQAAGANLLIETIENLTGLSVDHYMQVDLLGFYRISNALGGIQVNMCDAVSDSYSGLDLPKGVSTIKGKQALAFVRQRHGLGGGDLDRVKRQQYFLTASFRQVASAGILFKLSSLLDAIKQSIVVDEGLNLLDLGRQLQHLSADNIIGQTIPFEGFENVSVGSVEIVDPAKVRAFVSKLIGPTDDKLAGAKPVAPSAVTAKVLNAGAAKGAASTAARVLTAQGFTVSGVGDAPSEAAATTIQYADGMQAQAKTLLQYVPGAALVKADVPELTVLLGSDGVTAKPKTAPKAPASTSAKPTATASSSAKPAAIDSSCIH